MTPFARPEAYSSSILVTGQVRDIMQRLFLALIALYRYAISPLIPGHCRFTPSCSEYAREAVLRHGAFCGSLLAVWRLLRCQPLCAHGYDPVPQTLSWRAPWERRRARLAAK